MLENVLWVLAEGVANEFTVQAWAAMGAGIAVLGGAGCAIGEGFATAKAIEAIGRNPEASGTIRSTMIISCALVETTGIYALLISLLLLFLVAL